MAKSTSVAYKRLASLLARKRDQPCRLVIPWLRCHLSFSLLRSAITCLRGARSSSGHTAHNGPIGLVVSEGRVPFEKLCHFSHSCFLFFLRLPFVQSYISYKKLQKKKKKNDVIVNGSQRCERRATCTLSSGLLGVLVQYAVRVRIPLHADVRTELKTAVNR